MSGWHKYGFVVRLSNQELADELMDNPPRERSSEYIAALTAEAQRRIAAGAVPGETPKS